MRKLFLLATLFAMGLAASPARAQQTFENELKLYRIELPAGWTRQDDKIIKGLADAWFASTGAQDASITVGFSIKKKSLEEEVVSGVDGGKPESKRPITVDGMNGVQVSWHTQTEQGVYALKSRTFFQPAVRTSEGPVAINVWIILVTKANLESDSLRAYNHIVESLKFGPTIIR